MVNQGPKGYCAPATVERAMRYMLIPADMYVLATSATKAEGRTNTGKLLDDCKRIIRSQARKVEEIEIDGKLKIKDIKKTIDKGVPIVWRMRSLDGYNTVANRRSKERLKVVDLQVWSLEIQKEADEKAEALIEQNENHHLCMIIGYNEKSKEVAVSDSWGPKFEIRWVHRDFVRAVSNKGSFVIDF